MATAVSTSSSRPRFRTDLVAEPIEEEGQRYVDVIDPDTGSAFRFYDVEYSIACAMDGERDIAGLVEWAREELGLAPTSSELATVISTLGDLGYLDAAEETARAPKFDEDLDLGAPGVLAPGVVSRPAPAPISARPQDVDLDVELGFASPRPRPLEAPAPLADDLELGHAAPARAKSIPAPSAPAQMLGPAGAANEDSLSETAAVMEFDALTPPPPPEEIIATRPVLRPLSRADADEDGPTNLPRPHIGDFDDDEVSVDLTDHMPLRPNDVKEAVRASQVMRAVEVPPELMDQLDEREKQIAANAEAAKQAARKRAVSEVPTTPIDRLNRPAQEVIAQALASTSPKAPGEAAAAERGAVPPLPSTGMDRIDRPSADRPPVELPRDAVAVSRPKAPSLPIPRQSEQKIATPVPPVAPQPSRTWPLLLGLLFLAIVAVAGFFIWKLVIAKPTETVGPTPGETPPAETPPVETPPTETPPTQAGSAATSPPPVETPPPATVLPTATLASTTAGGAEIKAPGTGFVAFAIASGTEVKAEDVVVKLGGYQKFEARLGDGKTGGLLWDIEKRVPREIESHKEKAEAARAAGSVGQAKLWDRKAEERTARLEQKKKERDIAQAALDKFVVRAGAAGTVKTNTAPGKRVKEGDVVAQLDGARALTATFKVEGKTYAADQGVQVSAKASPDQKVGCTVTAVKATEVSVTCPAEGGLADGAEVVLH